MSAVKPKTKRYENGMRFDLRREREGISTRFLISEKAVDIETPKRAEDQLRRNERELRQITDALPQPVIVFAPDGCVLYGNESALEHTGLSLAEMLMGNFCAIHPDDVER